MSAKRISVNRYECVCELPDCPGEKQPWISEDDRIPERCRWCGKRTWDGQLRRAHLVTAYGRTQRVSEWAKETGIGKALIRFRIMAGWSPEDAVSVLPKKGKLNQ